MQFHDDLTSTGKSSATATATLIKILHDDGDGDETLPRRER